MNYKIINDEEILDNFIAELPPLTADQVFYVGLFARHKYLTAEQKVQIKSKKPQLTRFTCTAKSLKAKLRQLERPLGSYNPPNIPSECLSAYITINPRSLSLATKEVTKKFVERLLDNPSNIFNPASLAMSEIQKSPAKKKKWFVLDIDVKESLAELETTLKSFLGSTPYRILETRGGYHILIDQQNISKDVKKTWHQNIVKAFKADVDVIGDVMIPIPGTNQGTFTPKFV